MRAIVADPPPPEFEALLERRRQWGADTHDEVWDGVLHMVPAPNYGHASIEAQLLVILTPQARAAGLEVIGQSNRDAGERSCTVTTQPWSRVRGHSTGFRRRSSHRREKPVPCGFDAGPAAADSVLHKMDAAGPARPGRSRDRHPCRVSAASAMEVSLPCREMR